MAISQVISPIPQWMHRDEVKIFPQDQNTFVATNEAVYDHLAQILATQLNNLATQANQTQVQINQSELNTLGYRDTTKTYRDETLTNKNLTLQYKTSTELTYSNTVTLLGTLVIPTESTYNKDYIDDMKRRDFLNFKIGA